jgi:uncharacterized integral membrane protein (TIGR00697 family)
LILTVLAMAFITTLVVANIIAIKLFAFDVPIIPDDWLIDNVWVLPVSSFTYPITFLITDTIAELYGRRTTTRIVWIGFGCSILMLAMIYIGKILPGAGFWIADGGQEHYDFILGSVPRIVAGSMVAYLVSQNFDVFAFHFWKERTDGRHLWFRNNASTMMSQGIDTALFITIAFAGTVPGSVLATMLIGQYLVKVCLAALDTPVVYVLIGAIRKYGRSDPAIASGPQD